MKARFFKHCLICLNRIIDVPITSQSQAGGGGGTAEGLDGGGGVMSMSREKNKGKRGRPPNKHCPQNCNTDGAGGQAPPTFQATDEGSNSISSADIDVAESCSPGQPLECISGSEVVGSPHDTNHAECEGQTGGMEGSKLTPMIVKRGRGRPPKNNGLQGKTVSGVKRGRGRPPKNSGLQGTMNVMKMMSGVKRGRGRPPKNNGFLGKVKIMKVTSGVKRGRGRPPILRPPSLEVTSENIRCPNLADVPLQSTRAETSTSPPLEEEKDNSILYLRLLWMAKRFLNIPTTRFLGAHAKMKKSMTTPFCHQCVQYVGKLYELYTEWENVRMGLAWRLTQIRETILQQFKLTNARTPEENFNGSERRMRRVSNQLNLGSTQAVNRFRKLVALRCAEKIKSFGALPQVILDRNSMKHKWSIPFDHMFNYMKSLIVIFVLAAKKVEEDPVGDEQGPVTDNVDVILKEKADGVVAVKSEVESIQCKRETDPDTWELTSDNDDIFEAAPNSPPPQSPAELHEESSEDSAKHDNGKKAEAEVEPTLNRSFNFRKRARSINYVEEEAGLNDNSDSDISDRKDAEVTPAADLGDPTRISEKKFACNICKRTFNTGSRLKAHLSRSHFLLPFKCDQCHQRCRTNQQLVIHKKKMHSQLTSKVDQTPQPTACTICQEEFPSKTKMKEHRRQSHKGSYKCKDFTCDICGALVKGVSRFSQHMKKHNTPKPPESATHTCEKCSRTHKTAKGLRLHLMFHKRNPDWKPTPIRYGKLRPEKNTPLQSHIICEVSGCDKRFCSKAGYEVHLILHKDNFSCSICTEAFPNYKLMFKHLNLMHEPEAAQSIPCTHCHKSFSLEQTYDLHKKIQHPYLYKLRCDSEFCLDTFDTLEELREHVKDQHLPPNAAETVEDLEEALQFFRPSNSTSQDTGADVRPPKSVTGELGLFTCKRCKRSFPTRVALTLHLFAHSRISKSGTNNFECALCGKIVARLARLQHHFLKTHAKHIKYCLWCPVCQKTVYREHMKLHDFPRNQHNVKWRNKEGKRIRIREEKSKQKQKITCQECPDQLEFQTIVKLNVHREECHGLQRTHKCTVEGCGKAFFNSGSLRGHMREHDKKFQCHLCPRKCATNGKLLQHLRVHAQEKNHACQFCGKMFVALSGLKIHLDIHMGIKNYKCSYCDKAFCQKFALDCHERTHTKEKPFLCKFCGKGFGTQSVLRTHEKIHVKLGSSVILRRPFRKTIAGGSDTNSEEMSTEGGQLPDQRLQEGTSSGSGTLGEPIGVQSEAPLGFL